MSRWSPYTNGVSGVCVRSKKRAAEGSREQRNWPIRTSAEEQTVLLDRIDGKTFEHRLDIERKTNQDSTQTRDQAKARIYTALLEWPRIYDSAFPRSNALYHRKPRIRFNVSQYRRRPQWKG